MTSIVVGHVVAVGDVLGLDDTEYLGLRHIEEWSEDRSRYLAETPEPAEPCTAHDIEEHGLDEVVAVVCREDIPRTVLTTDTPEPRVSLDTSGLFESFAGRLCSRADVYLSTHIDTAVIFCVFVYEHPVRIRILAAQSMMKVRHDTRPWIVDAEGRREEVHTVGSSRARYNERLGRIDPVRLEKINQMSAMIVVGCGGL